MSKVMVSLPGEFLRDVDALASSEHRSRSELVREAIRTYVATRVAHRQGPVQRSTQRAAVRILKTRLQLPKDQSAESVIRKMREARYGLAWKNSSSTAR